MLCIDSRHSILAQIFLSSELCHIYSVHLIPCQKRW